jgi:signal transduction histidine kinase
MPRPGSAEELLHARAQLLREQQARFAAEASAWRLRRTQALLATLAGAESAPDVGRALLEHALSLLGAAVGSLHLVRDDNEMLELLCAAGYPRAAVDAWHWMPLAGAMPPTDAVRGGNPIWIGSTAQTLARYPQHMHGLAPIAPRAIAALPLAEDRRILGVLTLTFEEERVFTSVEQARAAELLALATPALARACRYAPLHARGTRAIAALRERDQQVVAACHDLKLPLTAIQMASQLLQRRLGGGAGPDLGSVLEQLTRIDSTVTRATAMVDEMVAQADLQPVVPASTAVDLVALIHRVAGEAQADQPAQRIVVRANPPSIVGRWVGAQLERVFANLLDNALKYSPREARVEVYVGVDTVADDRWAVTRIRDRGLGIPEKDLPRVFDRFQRGSNALGHLPGSGVGLSSVRELVEHHGGAVEVVSHEGRGSTFTVRLPLPIDGSDTSDQRLKKS